MRDGDLGWAHGHGRAFGSGEGITVGVIGALAAVGILTRIGRLVPIQPYGFIHLLLMRVLPC